MLESKKKIMCLPDSIKTVCSVRDRSDATVRPMYTPAKAVDALMGTQFLTFDTTMWLKVRYTRPPTRARVCYTCNGMN